MTPEVDSWSKMLDKACIMVTLISYISAYEPNVFSLDSIRCMHLNQSNCWVFGQLLTSSTSKLPWWILPLWSSDWLVFSDFTLPEPLVPGKLQLVLRESIPRKIDKKSRVPNRRKWSKALKEEKRTNILFLHCFVLVNITMYLAWGRISP